VRKLVGAALVAGFVLAIVALAEAGLGVLVLVFSAVLEIRVVFVVGSRVVQFLPSMAPRPVVGLTGWTVVLSLLLFLTCGTLTGALTFRGWRRAA
jgi:hypothetical protein